MIGQSFPSHREGVDDGRGGRAANIAKLPTLLSRVKPQLFGTMRLAAALKAQSGSIPSTPWHPAGRSGFSPVHEFCAGLLFEGHSSWDAERPRAQRASARPFLQSSGYLHSVIVCMAVSASP